MMGRVVAAGLLAVLAAAVVWLDRHGEETLLYARDSASAATAQPLGLADVSAHPELTEAGLAGLPAELRQWYRGGQYLNVFGQFRVWARVIEHTPAGETAASKNNSSSSTTTTPTPTFLFLHGFPSASAELRRAAPLLARHGRVVTVDFVGYGLSSKPTANFSYSLGEQAEILVEAWRLLGVRPGSGNGPLHLVSHDMGDSVLTELLARRDRGMLPPPFADRAAFASVTFNNGGMVYRHINMRLSQRLLQTRFGWLLTYASRRIDRQQRFARQQLGSIWGRDTPAAEREADVRDLLALNRFDGADLVIHRTIHYLADRRRYETRWLRALARIDMPVRIVWGDSDAVAPPAIAHTLASTVNPTALEGGPGAVTWLRGRGHFLMLEDPEGWVAAVAHNR